MGRVAVDEAVAHQFPLDRVDSADHPRIGQRKETDQRYQKQGSVERSAAVILDERVALGIPTASAHIRMYRVPHLLPALSGTGKTKPLHRLDTAVECHPRHDLRERELLLRA